LIKILNIVGARPNFMKIAPLMREMSRHEDIQAYLVHTGQHYDDNLSQVFFDELGIPRPDINLGIGSGTRREQIARIQAAFEPVVAKEDPDLVLVVGDVNSTIACAGVARRHKVPVAHVEAGLRSFDPTMPEEHNRRETDQIADFLFVTEESGLKNIEAEGLTGRYFLVGNVMIDSLAYNRVRIERSGILDELSLRPHQYMAATFHRPGNVDALSALRNLVGTITGICERSHLVLPLHPRTRDSLNRHELLEKLKSVPRLILTEPLRYFDFLKLVSLSKAVITDSGGIQEETTWLGIPCLTMRENTERPITISVGTNVLVGSDREKLIREVEKIEAGHPKKGEIPHHWDGKAAERIVAILRRELSHRIQQK